MLPNYINSASADAEASLNELSTGKQEADLGVEKVTLDRDEILHQLRDSCPDRYNLVVSKLDKEGCKLEDLPDNVLLDRALGIDSLFRFDGRVFAVDVTSGNGTILYNKQQKFDKLKPAFDRLGIDHAIVLSISRKLTGEQRIDFLEQLMDLPSDAYCKVIKYRNNQKQN